MLRWYQEEAVQSVFRYFQYARGNPLIAMPTATGKSHVIAEIIARAMGWWPGQRFMVATHVKELIKQDFDKLVQAWPLAPIGVFSAGLGLKQAGFPITFGGVKSILNALKKDPYAFGHIDVLFIDECHLVGDAEDSSYMQMIRLLQTVNPRMKVIGLSATIYRLGMGMLTEGKLFTDVCYDITGMEAFNRLISEGWLCPLIPRKTSFKLDVSKVPVDKTGEYNQGKLQEAVNKESITARALEEVFQYAHDRQHWLCFSSGIEHAEDISEYMNSRGVNACAVTSKTPSEIRDTRIAEFKAGRYTCMVGNNIFTTGFDYPEIDLIIDLQPTTSTAKHVQKNGRGTRPAPNKTNCLVMDFAGNTRRIGPINDPVIPNPKSKTKGTAPIKTCPKCDTENHISVRFCIYCGAEFDFAVKIEETAGSDELIKFEIPHIETFYVQRVTYQKHIKDAMSPPTLHVTYHCDYGNKQFREFIAFESHKQFAKNIAATWWRLRHWSTTPQTVDEALRWYQELHAPKYIRVHTNLKPRPKVIGYEWGNDDKQGVQVP